MSTGDRPLRQMPRGRWVHSFGRLFYVVGNIIEGWVSPLSAYVDGESRPYSRRCEAKRWVEARASARWYATARQQLEIDRWLAEGQPLDGKNLDIMRAYREAVRR